MRVIFVGDAGVSTGFARCTHAACDALHAAGHEVLVLGINYWGKRHVYPYAIEPCYQPLDGGKDLFGVDLLPARVLEFQPDAIVLLNDPWNVQGYLTRLAERLPEGFQVPPIVGWIAVDAENVKAKALNGLAHVMVWTDFAAREIEKGGYAGSTSIVPLGVDLSLFGPRDKAESRKLVVPDSIPEDAFIVGVVGRNQYPRKKLDLALHYFAEWTRKHQIENAYLYLHVAPTGDRGYDLPALACYHGLQGRVLVHEPHIGEGIPSEQMANVYSAFDVYLNTTLGEGWGLPTLEAMACGVPCIVPDWSGLGDWTGDAAVKVHCSGLEPVAPQNAKVYTLGGVMDRADCIEELQAMHASEIHRQTYARRGRRLAESLTWDRTGKLFVSQLESVLAEFAPEPTSEPAAEITEAQVHAAFDEAAREVCA